MKRSYNLKYLNELIRRDGAELIEYPTPLNRESKPKFKCGKCKNTIVDYKIFRNLYEYKCICKECGYKVGKEKREQKLLETKGVKNPNDIPGVKEKIKETKANNLGENFVVENASTMADKRWDKTKQKYLDIERKGEKVCEGCNIVKGLNEFKFNENKEREYKVFNKLCKECFKKNRNTKRNEKILNASLKEFFEILLIPDARNRTNGFNKKNPDNQREFNITSEYLVNIWEQQQGKCYYSGRDLQYNKIKEDLPEDKRIHPERVSIDRIDSKKGYIEGNIVLCCWTANNIKQDLSIEEFKKWIYDINNMIN